jgi:hypothetical protein
MENPFDLDNIEEQISADVAEIKAAKTAQREADLAKGLAALDLESLLEKTGSETIEKLQISEAAQKILENMDPAVVSGALDKFKLLGIEPIGIVMTGRMGDAGQILELIGKKADNSIESIELDGRRRNTGEKK